MKTMHKKSLLHKVSHMNALAMFITGIPLLVGSAPLSGETYKQGNFSIKPLNLYLFSRGVGFGRKDSKIDSNEVDAFKGMRGLGFSSAERNGIGYSLELSYMLTNQIELYLTPQVIYEAPQDKISSDRGGVLFRSFDFESRYTFGASLGGRYYFEIKDSKWVPHMGANLGFLRQGETKAVPFTRLPLGGGFVPLGPSLQLQPARTIFTAAFEVGIDYRFNDTYALTFATGINFEQRPDETTTTLAGNPLQYQNNFPRFSVPVVASFKITF